ncbi:MAG: hypothetical protein IJ593_10050 [Lachnospiraceae bacterium]|nr:hypothetical protein [Lachnospiraceae bacterium]
MYQDFYDEFGNPIMNNGIPVDNFGIPLNYKGPKENYYFEMDEGLLSSLGFTVDEINILRDAVNFYGLISVQKLSQPPFLLQDMQMVQRIMYAYNICMGKKVVDTTEPHSIAAHFKKMAQLYNVYPSFDALKLKKRQFNLIPRTAVIAGIPQGNFFVLNSNLYNKMDATYRVEKIAKEWVTIYSERKMAVGYSDRLNDSYENREWGIPDVLKVLEVGDFAEDRPWKLMLHKKYCRLCNRFMIIVTSKKISPETLEHNGGYTVITNEGQIITIYAKTTDFDSYGNPRESIPNSNNNTAIIDYGFYKEEVQSKLDKALNELQKNWTTVYVNKLANAIEFKEVSPYSGMTSIRNNSDESDEYDDDEMSLDVPEEEDIE